MYPASLQIALDVSVMWESPPLNSQVLSGGVATLYAFYVPLRLLWSGWIDFIAQDGGTVPTTSTNWAQMFEANASGNAVSSFYRRAYKLIYNQFFGSEKFGTWYANIETDTEVNTFLCRNLDQLAGHLVDSADAPDPTYIAAVSGAQATISLNDFRKAMKEAYATRRADMTGDKYVDAMRRMGVALDWRVQMAPEFLGKSEVDFYPKRTRVTTQTVLDGRVNHFVVLGIAVVLLDHLLAAFFCFHLGRKRTKETTTLVLVLPDQIFGELEMFWMEMSLPEQSLETSFTTQVFGLILLLAMAHWVSLIATMLYIVTGKQIGRAHV